MKAILHYRYGPPSQALELRDVEVPTPKENEVLVKVRASSVNPADWYLTRGKPLLVRLAGAGFFRPRSSLAGADVAGTVTAVGNAVHGFHPGDEVFGMASGSFAEFVTAAEDSIVPKPVSLSFEEAAGVPLAGLTALQALRNQGQVHPGQKVLIQGASGGVGSFAIQLAKAFGAEVTAVCSTAKIEMARSLGADHVIDYTEDDFSRSDTRYHLVLAINGFHPIRDYRRVLTDDGRCVLVGGSIGQIMRGLLVSRFTRSSAKRPVRTFMMRSTRQDLLFLKELLETGKLKPVMDRSFPLGSVSEALSYLHEGHARGKITITVS